MSAPTATEGQPYTLRSHSPRDWIRLGAWIAFQPSRLKRHLYHSAPELYRAGPGWDALNRVAATGAYSAVLKMVPLLAWAGSLAIGLMISAVTAIWQGMPFDTRGLFLGSFYGLIHGALLCLAFLLLSAYVLDVAVGVVMGVTLGVVAGMAVGVASSVAYALPEGPVSAVAEAAAFGLAFGLVLPAVGGVASDLAASAALSVVLAAGLPVLSALLRSMGLPLTLGLPPASQLLVPAVVFATTALRLPIYLVELVLVLTYRWHGLPHPVTWDELLMVPLPRSVASLRRALRRDAERGLSLIARVVRNPFQRWAAEAALHDYLNATDRPLHWLYSLFRTPGLGDNAALPLESRDWRDVPTLRQVLLAGLGQRLLASQARRGWVEEFIWTATAPLRQRRSTPLTRFAGLLYDLTYGDLSTSPQELVSRREEYVDLDVYPGAEEIRGSLDCLATWLTYRQFHALRQAPDACAGQPLGGEAQQSEPIRPRVLHVMEGLSGVGRDIGDYLDADNRVARLTALAHASEALESLGTLVEHTVVTPEQLALTAVIERWTHLVREEGGDEARDTLRRALANPYTVSAPVVGKRFIGREDVLLRLEELWSGTTPRPSLVLYGQPFIGKSSLLLQIGERFGETLIIVDFNVQRVGLVQDTVDLLTNLALALYDSLDAKAREQLDRPRREYLANQNPYMAFDRFLRALAPLRGDRDVVITMDEYEVLDELVSSGQLDPHLPDFVRSLIQTYSWLVLVLAGRHNLRGLEPEWWRPLASAVLGVRLGPMEPDDARHLLREPAPGFTVSYEPEALDIVVHVTARQPFLLQMVGHHLFSRFNRGGEPASARRQQRFGVEDVQEVLDDPALAIDGSVYLHALTDAVLAGRPPQRILDAMAQDDSALSTEELADAWGVPREQAERALRTWQQWEVVQRDDGGWRIAAPLVKRWVTQAARA